MLNVNPTTLLPAVAVDELAVIKAEIARLQEKEKALVAALKATGMDRIIGTLHEATISLSERKTFDGKAFAASMGATEADMAPFYKTTDVETLKVTARKTSK